MMRNIIVMWNMRGTAEIRRIGSFKSHRMQTETDLSRHGFFWANEKATKPKSKLRNNLRARLLEALDTAIKSGDTGAEAAFHDHLVDQYAKYADWHAACEHIDKLKQTKPPSAFIEGPLLTSMLPRIDLRKASATALVCYVLEDNSDAAQRFAAALGNIELVRRVFRDMGVDFSE